jgi:hypothetical protein
LSDSDRHLAENTPETHWHARCSAGSNQFLRGCDVQKLRYDQPLRKLRQVREELRQEYSRIRHDLVRLEKMIGQLEAMNSDGHADDSAIAGLSHAQAATLILSKAPAPMTIRQILDALERAGRTFSAKNGYGILHKSLRGHKEFDSIAGRWRLVASAPAAAPNLKLA